MHRKELLLRRLEGIGQSLAHTGGALALLGLGSSGLETDRLDEFSDLDFFVIVRPGEKTRFLADLGWLERVHPLVYAFRNTVDGYKVLFADEVFGEFAVFEPEELPRIPFAPGRVVWKMEGLEEAVLAPVEAHGAPEPSTVEWLLGEALTNLYVGLCRFGRGEKLSAQRLIQGYAVERLLALAGRFESEGDAAPDPFDGERRFEKRFPELAQELPEFLPGYERSPQAAIAILTYLEERFEVNPALKAAILKGAEELILK